MIPMHPCGMICDYGHHRYRTKVRFFRDSDREDIIEWFPAAAGAKTLPFTSAFMRSVWDRDPDNLTVAFAAIGEVQDSPHITSQRKAVVGSGRGHYCGTEEDFRVGAVYDPAYTAALRPSGMPACCPEPPAGLGFEWGGRVVEAAGGYLWNGGLIPRNTLLLYDQPDGYYEIGRWYERINEPANYTSYANINTGVVPAGVYHAEWEVIQAGDTVDVFVGTGPDWYHLSGYSGGTYPKSGCLAIATGGGLALGWALHPSGSGGSLVRMRIMPGPC